MCTHLCMVYVSDYHSHPEWANNTRTFVCIKIHFIIVSDSTVVLSM